MSFFSRKSRSSAQPSRRRKAVSGDEGAPARAQTPSYRRGRTMPGSTGHTLKSAQPHAIHNATPREKIHHLTGLRRKLSIVFSVLLVAVVLLVIFLEQFTASVKVSFEDTAQVPDDAAYEQVIQEYLTQHPTERLRFNLDSAGLREFMVERRPEVKNISQVGYAGLVTSGYQIELRKPVVSWQVQDKRYFVDSQGVSFTDTIYGEPPVKIIDNSGVEHTSGTAIASARFLTFVGKAVALAQESSLEVASVAIPTGSSRQVEILLEGRPYPVIMSIDRSAGEQVEDMARVVQYFDKQGRVPSYVDIRVKGKAFFRE